LRQILHEVAQRRRRTRLHTFPGARQNIVGNRWLSNRSSRRRGRQGGLQGPDRAVERKSVNLQYVCGDAAPVADDRRKYDGAVDIPPSATSGGCRRGFEDTPHIMRNAKTCRRLRGIDARLSKLPHNVRFERRNVNAARVEHRDGVRIVAERGQQMLKGNIGRTGASSKLGSTR